MGYTLVEVSVLYFLGTLIIALRCICRWQAVGGIRNFKPDDYLVVLAWMTYTVMTFAADIVIVSRGDLHSLPMSQRQELTENDATSYISATKWFCAGQVAYIVFIWLLKINMLFFLERVVKGLRVARFVKPVLGMVVATLFIILCILLLSCRPYNRMWTVFPDQGPICKPNSVVHMVPAMVLNLVTDICIMAIPAPVILPLKMTLWRKIGLVLLFGGGIFIMVATILRTTFSLVAGDGLTHATWACREDIVAIIVGQAPMLRPVFTKGFWIRPKAHRKESDSEGEPSLDVLAQPRYRMRDPDSIPSAMVLSVYDASERPTENLYIETVDAVEMEGGCIPEMLERDLEMDGPEKKERKRWSQGSIERRFQKPSCRS